MKGDKISVIVPAYNVEDYIENTVKSICNQNYRNLEIILVDDGSKDQTPTILDNLAKIDNRIKVIHKKNGGVTSARICGIKEATGNWIGFVDGDDYIEPQMYEMLLNNALEYGADISHCGYQMVFPSRVDFYYGTGRVVEQDFNTALKDLLEGTFVEPGLWNKLFHRSLLQSFLEEEKMDLTIKNNEDLLMNFYLFRCSQKSIYVDDCPYHYILRKGSATTSNINESKLQDPLKVLKILEKETVYDNELQFIVKRRIVALLIRLSTMSLKENPKLICAYRKSARKELSKKISEILYGKYSIKQKIMVIWVLTWPDSYMWVHALYARVTGLDRKYDIV